MIEQYLPHYLGILFRFHDLSANAFRVITAIMVRFPQTFDTPTTIVARDLEPLGLHLRAIQRGIAEAVERGILYEDEDTPGTYQFT